jgi:hypothetical protein
MKVRCIRATSEGAASLKVDKVYLVLGVYIELDRRNMFRILLNEANPSPTTMGYFQAADFEVVDTSIPSGWSVRMLGVNIIDIGPATWQTTGWLESLYDGDRSAIEDFQRECTAARAGD